MKHRSDQENVAAVDSSAQGQGLRAGLECYHCGGSASRVMEFMTGTEYLLEKKEIEIEIIEIAVCEACYLENEIPF